MYDVVTFGEAMIRLSPSHFQKAGAGQRFGPLCRGGRIECGRGRNPFWDEERVGLQASKEWTRLSGPQPRTGIWNRLLPYCLVRSRKGWNLFCRVWGISARFERSLRSGKFSDQHGPARRDRLDKGLQRIKTFPCQRDHPCPQCLCVGGNR